jgi:hypothetical protein
MRDEVDSDESFPGLHFIDASSDVKLDVKLDATILRAPGSTANAGTTANEQGCKYRHPQLN